MKLRREFMTVKEIVALTCDFVGEKELAIKLRSSESQTYSQHEQQKIDSFVRIFNLVNQEISSDYLPFVANEVFSSQKHSITLSSLKQTLVSVLKVYGVNKNEIAYKISNGAITSPNWIFEIDYLYTPKDLALDGAVEFENGLSGRVYAYGMASEYLLIDGISEDAEIWEKRFKESLFLLSRKKGEHVMPKRSWS